MALKELSDAPGRQFELIIADPQDLDYRAFYVAVSGIIAIANQDLSTEAGVIVVAGTVIPVAFRRVTALGGGAVLYGIK